MNMQLKSIEGTFVSYILWCLICCAHFFPFKSDNMFFLVISARTHTCNKSYSHSTLCVKAIAVGA